MLKILKEHISGEGVKEGRGGGGIGQVLYHPKFVFYFSD